MKRRLRLVSVFAIASALGGAAAGQTPAYQTTPERRIFLCEQRIETARTGLESGERILARSREMIEDPPANQTPSSRDYYLSNIERLPRRNAIARRMIELAEECVASKRALMALLSDPSAEPQVLAAARARRDATDRALSALEREQFEMMRAQIEEGTRRNEAQRAEIRASQERMLELSQASLVRPEIAAIIARSIERSEREQALFDAGNKATEAAREAEEHARREALAYAVVAEAVVRGEAPPEALAVATEHLKAAQIAMWDAREIRHARLAEQAAYMAGLRDGAIAKFESADLVGEERALRNRQWRLAAEARVRELDAERIRTVREGNDFAALQGIMAERTALQEALRTYGGMEPDGARDPWLSTLIQAPVPPARPAVLPVLPGRGALVVAR